MTPMADTRWVLGASVWLAAVGCDDEGSRKSLADAVSSDMAVADAGPADATPADVDLPDAAPSDATRSDSEPPDAAIPDAAIPDAAIPDAAIPDVTTLDAAAPDVSRPDAQTSDAGSPDWVVETPTAVVPEGWFIRGTRFPQDPDDEKPIRQIWVDAYDIDRYEISVAAYGACVDAGACGVPVGQDPRCTWGSRDEAGDLPISCVTHAQANQYCRAVGRRLPTEAEWEKAARGGCERRPEPECELGIDDVELPWGGPELTCRQVRSRLCGDWETGPQPVWWRSPDGDSIYGVSNLSGNVREWIADAYDEGYYAWSRERNPWHRRSSGTVVVRGAGFDSGGRDLIRVPSRAVADPQNARPQVGFRCARADVDRGIADDDHPEHYVDDPRTILTDVPEENLARWTRCARFGQADAIELEDLESDCAGDRVLLACRHERSLDYRLVAAGPRDVVFGHTGNEGLTAGEVRFWFVDEGAFGFAPEGVRADCAVDDALAPSAMCAATADGSALDGFDCGGARDRYEWHVYVRD